MLFRSYSNIFRGPGDQVMDKTFVGLLVLLFILIWLDIHNTVNHYEKCKDAGGVYVTTSVCINPAAVIEVN